MKRSSHLYSDLKTLLSHITIDELIKRIEVFRKNNFKSITDNELSKKILDVLSVDINGVKRAHLIPRIGTYKANTRFYRVRKLPTEDHFLPLKTMRIEQDAWNAPKELIKKKGRLNKEHESLLYVSPLSPIPAIEEMKIDDGEGFCLIAYEAKQDVKVNAIGIWDDIPELTSEENLKMRIVYNFLKDEFTREVGEGTEHLYRISETIAKDYFDLPPKTAQDAWLYPSIANKKFFNVCFRPEIAKEQLELLGFQYCRIYRDSRGYQIDVSVIASGFDNLGNFKYYPITHPLCKEKFPEIVLKKDNIKF